MVSLVGPPCSLVVALTEVEGFRGAAGKAGLGTVVSSAFPLCDVAVADFGAWMERMVVFVCRLKGLGASRGLGARAGLGFDTSVVWEASTELSIIDSLEGKRTQINPDIFAITL